MAAYGEISTAAVRPRTRRYEPGRSWRSWRSEAMMAVLNGAAFSRACASVIEPRSSPRRRVTHARCTSTMDRMMITAATSRSTTTVANHMSQRLINTPHPSIPAAGRASFMRHRPGPSLGGISCSTQRARLAPVRLAPIRETGRHPYSTLSGLLAPCQKYDRAPAFATRPAAGDVADLVAAQDDFHQCRDGRHAG